MRDEYRFPPTAMLGWTDGSPLQADTATRLANYEGESHQRHLHNGGTEAAWPAIWRELKQRWLIDQADADAHERCIKARATVLRQGARYHPV